MARRNPQQRCQTLGLVVDGSILRSTVGASILRNWTSYPRAPVRHNCDALSGLAGGILGQCDGPESSGEEVCV